MSYAQGTTHYNFPQIAGTDRPTFADANEAFRTIDTKLYALEGSTTEVDGRLDTAEDNIVQLQSDVQTAQGTADRAEGKANTANEEIGLTNVEVSQLKTRVGNKFDSVGIADPYDTAATYAVGDVVTYNGQRYRCTTAVTVAEPFDVTKWIGEDVETVLNTIKSNFNTGSYITLNAKVKYRKCGNIVEVLINGSIEHTTSMDLGTLPEGYRPDTNIAFASAVTQPPSDSNVNIAITSGGAIVGQSYSASGTTITIRGHVMYFV